jgi:hypothetical protein
MKQLVKITLQQHYNKPDTIEVSQSVDIQEGRFFYGISFPNNQFELIRKSNIGEVIDDPYSCKRCIIVAATRYAESPETYEKLLRE